MHDLEQELLETLQRSLPAAQVGVIKDRLVQAEEMEREVKKLKKELEDNRKYTSALYSENSNLEEKVRKLEDEINNFKLRDIDILTREEICHTKEINWAVIERDIKLECADKMVSAMFNLTSQAFSSPVFQTQQTGHMAVATQHGTIMQPFDMMTRMEAKVPTEHIHKPGPGSNMPTGGVQNY